MFGRPRPRCGEACGGAGARVSRAGGPSVFCSVAGVPPTLLLLLLLLLLSLFLLSVGAFAVHGPLQLQLPSLLLSVGAFVFAAAVSAVLASRLRLLLL